MELNRFDLCSLDALSAARLLARGAPIPPCMTHHKASAEYIISCVSAGWFMIPMHKDGSYSQSQTEQLHRLTRAHPDLGPAMLRAQEAAALARQQFKGADFELFGSTSNQRLTSPVHMASNAHISPRMPLSFERGAFRAEHLCDMLEDVTANCAAIHKYADTLATPGLLDPGADLALKIGQLVQADMGHLSTAIVRSIHGHYVTRDLSRKLQSVIYRGEPAVNFTAHLDQMFKEQALSSARHWQRIKKKIRLVAGVLSDCKNYHRPSVTRELRLHLGQQYGLVTLSTNKGRQIAVEIGEEVQLGSSTGTESTFELVNWVVALDSACASASDDIYGYIDACNTASAALDRMRQSLAG